MHYSSRCIDTFKLLIYSKGSFHLCDGTVVWFGFCIKSVPGFILG
jgi:hypothetical protein